MKRRLFTFALAALTIGLLGSCSKINERIDDLDKRVYDLENNKIASIDQQITAINTSINDLKAADVTINGKIADLKTAADAQQALIDALQEADRALGQKDTELEARIATLEGQVATINGQIATLEDADKAINLRIDTLKTYVDAEIGKTKDWAEETFATLEQYQQTADDLATLSVTVTGISTTLAGMQTSISGLDTRIDSLDTALQGRITTAKTELEGKIADLKTELEDKIASAITESEKSIKSWINELLEGYYKAAVVDEKINALNTAIEASKSTAKTRIDSLATELTKTKAAVDTVKANIRTEYKNAIDVAINKLDGEIRGALLDSIAAVNARIEALNTRVKTLEGKVLALEGKVDKLLAMVQSVTIVPAYSDGSVEAVNGILTLKCIVKPAEALIGMQSLKDSLVLYADSVKVKTKATTPAYMTIEVSEASVLDAAQGAITLTADISEYLPKGEDKALTVAVNIKNGISDFTTEFVPVCAVTVAPEGFVDLGVKDANGKPLFWAECNLGASNPQDYGDYFAWGETAPYYTTTGGWPATLTWKSEKESGYAWQSYCGQSSFVEWSTPPYDATSNILLPAYDAATKTNSSWRTPTRDEFKALAASCVWWWTTDYNSTGKAGYIVYKAKNNADKGKANMNGTWKKWDVSQSKYVTDGASEATGYTTSDTHIFFPAAGNGNGPGLDFAGSAGCYWSSSLYTDDTERAYSLFFKSGSVEPQDYRYRFFGISVRPVKAAPTPLPTGALAGEFSVSATKKVHFSKGNLVATIDATGAPTAWKFSAHQYDYIGNAIANNSIGSTAGDVDFFGWSTDAASNNWGIHTKIKATKNFTTGNFKDWGKAVGDGNTWSTLSKAEWTYLFDNHSKKWATVNGVKGYVIAPDGFAGTLSDTYADDAALAADNLVFLPAAGDRAASSVTVVGSDGFYWSSTKYGSEDEEAYDLHFTGSSVKPNRTDKRCIGCSVRLITEVK